MSVAKRLKCACVYEAPRGLAKPLYRGDLQSLYIEVALFIQSGLCTYRGALYTHTYIHMHIVVSFVSFVQIWGLYKSPI